MLAMIEAPITAAIKAVLRSAPVRQDEQPLAEAERPPPPHTSTPLLA